MAALLIYNARLVDKNTDEKGALLCQDGKIAAVFKGDFSDLTRASSLAFSFLCPEKFLKKGKSSPAENDGDQTLPDLDVFDAKGLVVTPAFIDMHVHLRDPGLTHKEDLESGLKAAMHGGYGTVVAMPNTSPVVSDRESALSIMERGNALGFSKLYQSVSITRAFEGSDISHLENLNSKEIPLITEDGHDVLSSSVMLNAMKMAASNGQIVSCHCEDPTLAVEARPHREKALKIMKDVGLSAWGGGDASGVFEKALSEIDRELSAANSLLELAEDAATERNIRLAYKAGCHIHICHISTRDSVEAVRRAKKGQLEKSASVPVTEAATMPEAAPVPETLSSSGKKAFVVTAEATPHHIALEGSREPMIRALVNPPLRSEIDRKSVIQGLRDGTIDCIATDHAPHTAEDKSKGAPGFSGIEASYGVCHSVLVKQEGFSESSLSALMSGNPAALLGLNKGLIKAGYDADFTLCDPEEEWTVEARNFFSKGKATPFEGMKVTGRVKGIILGGKGRF